MPREEIIQIRLLKQPLPLANPHVSDLLGQLAHPPDRDRARIAGDVFRGLGQVEFTVHDSLEQKAKIRVVSDVAGTDGQVRLR